MRLPRGRLASYALPSAIFGLALVVRLVPVLRGGGLDGMLAYDDGVYFSAASALLSGRLPYADYLLLHPPGITLVLAPFAALARATSDPVGIAVARLAFMAVGAASAVLAYRVARRLSPVAGSVAGVLYAVWPAAINAERTTLLEPLVNLGALGSLALLGDLRPESRRRTVLAGVTIGLAVAVKVWAAVPFALLGLWVLRRAGRRSAGWYVGAGVAAASAVCAPFVALAPGRMLHMVVLDQLGRADNGVSGVQRLAAIEGLALSPGQPTYGPVPVVVAVAAGAVIAAVAVRQAVARPWCALAVGAVAVVLILPVYFRHYSAFAAPGLVLVAGAAADLALATARQRRRELVRVAAGAMACCLAVLAIIGVLQTKGRSLPQDQVMRLVAGSRCVAADTPAALVVTDLLSRNLRRGCPVLVDVTGLAYDLDHGGLAAGPTPLARRRDTAWQRVVYRHLAAADAVLLARLRGTGLTRNVLERLTTAGTSIGTERFRVVVDRPQRR